MCCDDGYRVTPYDSALAGCDRLVSEPLVIKKRSVEDTEEDPEKPSEETLEEEEPRKKKSKETPDSGSNTGSLEYSASKEEVESYLESTARSEAKPKELENTCASGV
ncbi:hypothetical protein Tco_0152350 [Tanacetum coccineum]